MWVISKRRLREFWQKHPDAQQPLTAWYKIADKASWGSLQDIRKTLPASDGSSIRCRNTTAILVTVFNIGGNKYRLITQIDYKKFRVYVKFVLTHAEYNKNKWKVQICKQ